VNTDSKAYFDQVAEQWDSLRAGYFGEEVRRAAIQKAYLHPSMVVADVGAGTGFITAGLAPLVSHVHVVDGSAAMLSAAHRNLDGFPNLTFHVADGSSLPFEVASLDAVFANMYLHHCPDPLAAIREMVRVLRPGGRLVITDLDTHPYEWLRGEMADLWLGFERSQVRAWYQAAGLVNIVIDCTGQDCCAKSDDPDVEEASREARISVFVAAATRRVSGVHSTVQAGYTARAEGAACGCGSQSAPVEACCSSQVSNCCAPALISLESVAAEQVDYQAGYLPAELAAVPPEAAELSLGCGNPTALAGLQPGEVVLDIGSGGGIDVFLAARQVGTAGRVIGVDMTPAMLERARRSAQKVGLNQVEFRQGYAEKLPLADASVDVILSNCVINLTEDKGEVFREAWRVLKDGGRIEVSDVVLGVPPPLSLRSAGGQWTECVAGALPEAEYLDLISQAGFQEIHVRRSGTASPAAGVPVYGVLVSAFKRETRT
jgi:arsenite methyltransferase